MDKQSVIDFFGGSAEATAHALDITGQAVRQWPDPLSPAMSDRIIGAAIKHSGTPATRKAFPEAFER